MRLKTWSVQNWCSIQFNERVGRTQVSPQDKCCEVKNIISVRSEYLWRATAIFRLIKAEAEELKIDFRALRQPVTLDTPLPSAEAVAEQEHSRITQQLLNQFGPSHGHLSPARSSAIFEDLT